MVAMNLHVQSDALAEFCRRHHITKLSLFGSVLRSDFRSDSDVDVLVEFEPNHAPDFFLLHSMEQELVTLLGHGPVDLVTEKSLHPLIRAQVLATAEVKYAQG